MEERFVVHIVVDLTMMLRDVGWGRKHTGNRWSKYNFQWRCIIISHFSKRGDMLSPIVGLFIQLVQSTCSKRREKLAQVELRIPLSMWRWKIHMKKCCSSKSHLGVGLLRSGWTSWYSKTYSFCTYANFGCIYVFYAVISRFFEPPWIIDQGSDVQFPSANFLPEIFWVSARKAALDRRTSPLRKGNMNFLLVVVQSHLPCKENIWRLKRRGCSILSCCTD